MMEKVSIAIHNIPVNSMFNVKNGIGDFTPSYTTSLYQPIIKNPF